MTRRLHLLAPATALGIAALTLPGNALSFSVVYGYDKVGRLITALYDNGTCLVYAYDANGNRTSQNSTSATTTPVWGTGTFGCFSWTP